MKCFVTGASGFIGANLVHELVARGHQVKALVRPGRERRGVPDADYKAVAGDLTDGATWAAALRGCDWCFHVAARYHLWLPRYAPMYAANVEGTRKVIEAAFQAGCSRIVYTSTVGCIGQGPRPNGSVRAADERAPVSPAQMTSHYKRSKWKAEQVTQELISRGAPVVIVNPCAPAGPWDAKPTPTGQFIVDFLNRKMPAYLDTGLNWVHARDVAIGHILAAERGRVGERYILGHTEGNWTMRETLSALEEISGVRAPRVRIPYWVALIAAYVSESLARITARPPKAPLAGVRMARHRMFVDPSKAIRELGLPQTPPRQALTDAVQWFRQHGYVKE